METTQIGSQGQNGDVTRVLDGGAGGADRTMVAGSATADVTRMAANVPCPVCGTGNSSLEQYCAECGFLLSSTPGEEDETPTSAGSAFALVEERTGRRFPLHEGTNLVGRENGDVLLMEPTVSRRHAEIVVSGQTVQVSDLGSTNGTQVDGVPLTAGAVVGLTDGSILRFGNATFRFEGEGVRAELASVHPEPVSALSAEGSPPSGAVEAVARLRAVEAASGQVRTDILIAAGTTTIGRRPGNTHVIAGDPYVSGRHAEVTADADGVRITDVNSTNGTLVNGVKLTPHEPVVLLPGDEVAIGQTRFVFEEIEAPEGSDTAEADEDLTDRPDDLETSEPGAGASSSGEES